MADSAPLSSTEISALLASQRMPGDQERDGNRRPDKILAFTEIAEGDKVLDIFAGSGWYTELFSRAVGDSGTVYAQNDKVIWRFAEKGINARTQDNRLGNVKRFDAMPIAAMDIPDNSLDLVFTALNYHDLFFTESTDRNGNKTRVREEIVDYKEALAVIRDAMKDQGIFVIIDHSAKAGSGYDMANELHRIDPAIVRYQMQQAGFTLIEEAYYPEDDLVSHVFAKERRGKTDRFIYKFQKTAE